MGKYTHLFSSIRKVRPKRPKGPEADSSGDDPPRPVAKILPPAPESEAARRRRLRREPVGPGHAAGTMPREWWEQLRRKRIEHENRTVPYVTDPYGEDLINPQPKGKTTFFPKEAEHGQNQ